MTDSPAWLNTALKAAEDAIRKVPLAISGTTRETKNGLRNADEVVWEALRAFMDVVPIDHRYADPNYATLRQLKDAFTEQSDA